MRNQFQLTRRGRLLTPIIGAAILGIIILAIVSGVIQKWLWMQQLDYAVIFWTLLSVKWGMFCLAFVVAFLYLWAIPQDRLTFSRKAVSRSRLPA